MRLVVELARRNVRHGGGPFAAAIFNHDTKKLLAPGVNLVVPTNCSVAHAEIVALGLAQRIVGNFDLSAKGSPCSELVASADPCAMCLGAIPWSGVRRLVCGAREEDVRAVGFDEGAKPPDWVRTLEARGITVEREVCRAEAAAVLREYRDWGGKIYNGRHDAK
jgi:tRNA(Arg) A34 adenosine deaminase TadA